MGSEGIQPEGERIRKAVRWIIEVLREEKDRKRRDVIEEAERRFDLSPLECEFLERKLIEEGYRFNKKMEFSRILEKIFQIFGIFLMCLLVVQKDFFWDIF